MYALIVLLVLLPQGLASYFENLDSGFGIVSKTKEEVDQIGKYFCVTFVYYDQEIYSEMKQMK